jgi:pilus assembly protein CpaF
MGGVDKDGQLTGTFYSTGYEPEVLKRLAAYGYQLPTELFTARELTTGGHYVSRYL